MSMKKFQPVLELLRLKRKSELRHAFSEKGLDADIDCESFYDLLSTDLNLNVSEDDSNALFYQIDSYNRGIIKYASFETYVENYEEKCALKEEGPFYPTPSQFRGVRSQDNIFELTEYVAEPGSVDEVADHYVSLSRSGLLTYWRKDMTKSFETRTSVFEDGAKMLTMATGLVCIPKYKMIAVSTTAGDIRFFSASIYKFHHKFSIVWFSAIVLNMYCHDSEFLICGDFTGSVFLVHIDSSFFERLKRRADHLGPQKITFDDIAKGKITGLTYETTAKGHISSVVKVKFIPSIRAVISCSVNTKRALLIHHLDKTESLSFVSDGGVSSFDFCEKLNCLITGCIDNTVKLWNPSLNSSCTDTLTGHFSSVTHVLCDDERLFAVSADRDKTIRVWDLFHKRCLQTIKFKETCFPGKQPFSTLHFDKEIGKLIITTHKVTTLNARKSITRSQTHPESEIILLVVYNSVFEYFITVGNKSSVAVWSADAYELIYDFTEVHVAVNKDGIEQVVDITAAGLEATQRRLITAGRDGSVKVWNFHLGICLRHFQATFPILSLSFVGYDIFAAGASGQLFIFYDDGEDIVEGTEWKPLHKRAIVSVDCHGTALLATASSDGQIIIWLWKNEDAKLIMKDSVDEGKETKLDDEEYLAKSIIRKRRLCSITQMMFLQTREMDESIGNLVSCGIDGRIRFWNVICTNKMNKCKLLSKFRAVFRECDGVICMATDRKNKVLFTGDTLGYIRTYSLEDYYSTYGSIPASAREPSPQDIDKYPFLKLQALIQKNHSHFSKFDPTSNLELGYAPLLLNCYRGHMGSIQKIGFADCRSVVATAARPGTVRLWTIGGTYLGYLGESNNSDILLDVHQRRRRMPEDIKAVASVLTLHVLNGGKKPYWERGIEALKRCRLFHMPENIEKPLQWMRSKEDEKNKVSKGTTDGFFLQRELEKRLPYYLGIPDRTLNMHDLQCEDIEENIHT